tara:strand:- start:1147 stop:1662 length:516 start_codon:yes stop_codon:yes gene_type:complete
MTNKKVHRVFVGVPEELINSIFWVEREYRINPLSYSIGGTYIVVEFRNSRVLGYDWVKYPAKYLEKVLAKEVFEQSGQKGPIDIHHLKSLVSRIYAGVISDENSERKLHEIWASENSENLPFKKVEILTSESLIQYLEVFKRNLELSLKYISINFPFSYHFLLENWEDLDL